MSQSTAANAVQHLGKTTLWRFLCFSLYYFLFRFYYYYYYCLFLIFIQRKQQSRASGDKNDNQDVFRGIKKVRDSF